MNLDLSNDLKWLKGNLYEWVKIWEIFILLLLLLVVVIEDDSTCYRIFPLWQRCWISLLEMVHHCLPVNGAKGSVQGPSPYGCEHRVTNLNVFVATQRVMCFFLRAYIWIFKSSLNISFKIAFFSPNSGLNSSLSKISSNVLNRYYFPS